MEKGRLGRSVPWAVRLAPPFSPFLFFFSSPLFEFKFGLEFEFKIGVPYSVGVLDMMPTTFFYIY